MQTTIEQERDFELRVARHLRDRHPGAIAPFSGLELREYIHNSLVRGRAFGLTWQSSLVGFTVMMFEVGPQVLSAADVRAGDRARDADARRKRAHPAHSRQRGR